MKKVFSVVMAALAIATAFAVSQVKVLAVSEDPVVFVMPEEAPAAEPVAKAQLGDESEDMLYDAIQTALYNMEAEFSVPTYGLAEEDVLRIVRLAYNAPDIFWVESGSYVLDENREDMATFRFEYSCSVEERDRIFAGICQMADQIVAESDGTLEGVASAAAGWLDANVTYDNSGVDKGRSNAQITNAVMDGLTVCTGFSKTLDFVLLRAGYSAAYITGKTEVGLHAWSAYGDGSTVLYGDATFGCVNCPTDIHVGAENMEVLWLEPIA